MNVLATNPSACRSIAAQTMADRAADAQRRALVRTLRAERRAARRAAQASYDDSVQRLPFWAFRFVHPVH